MLWSRVKDVLLAELIGEMRNPSVGRTWLDALDEYEDGRRLGICMAIDVLSKAVEPKLLAEVLDAIDVSDAALQNPCLAFGQALMHMAEGEARCNSRFVAEPLAEDDAYLRVLTIGAFIDYYAGPTWESVTPDSSGQRRLKNMFFDPALPPVSLGMIKKTWAGANGVIWVTSYKDYEKLTAEQPPEEVGKVLVDMLGMGNTGSGELIGVKYPARFEQVRFYQPTTLAAGWTTQGGYYISYREHDRWGRTHSCTGRAGTFRERIHPKFEGGLTSEFSLLVCGTVADLQEDRDRLLVNAFRRIQALLDTHELESRRSQSSTLSSEMKE